MFPRVLHFIWLSEEIPPGRQACIDSCIEQHPGWDVIVWRSLDQFAGPLRNQRLFDAADEIAPPPPRGNRWQIVSNVLRFEIMLNYGGVYLDSDVWALGSLEPILRRAEDEQREGVLGWEIQDWWLGEAVIAAKPGAGFMERIVDRLEEWAFALAGQAATKTVGPQAITPILKGSPELDRVLVLPQQVFFPARHDQPELADKIIRGEVSSPSTVLVHRFANWRRKQGAPL